MVRGARRHLPVLVVDDGSGDGTASIAEAAGAEVLRQTPNQGKGAALVAGFGHALAAGAEAVVTLDADGQHDPAEIPKFLAAFGGGPDDGAGGRPDLVIGYRDFRSMPPVRRLANTLGRLTLEWALRTPVRDNQSGYRLIGRRLMEAMADSGEKGFEFEVEMVAACVRRGWPIAWVPIRTIYAGEPSHIRNREHLANFLRTAWRLRRSMRAAPRGRARNKSTYL